MVVVARIYTEFSEKFGIPRQSGLVPSLRGEIVFEPEFRSMDAIRGLEEFSHSYNLNRCNCDKNSLHRNHFR